MGICYSYVKVLAQSRGSNTGCERVSNKPGDLGSVELIWLQLF